MQSINDSLVAMISHVVLLSLTRAIHDVEKHAKKGKVTASENNDDAHDNGDFQCRGIDSSQCAEETGGNHDSIIFSIPI